MVSDRGDEGEGHEHDNCEGNKLVLPSAVMVLTVGGLTGESRFPRFVPEVLLVLAN